MHHFVRPLSGDAIRTSYHRRRCLDKVPGLEAARCQSLGSMLMRAAALTVGLGNPFVIRTRAIMAASAEIVGHLAGRSCILVGELIRCRCRSRGVGGLIGAVQAGIVWILFGKVSSSRSIARAGIQW